jgi:hypothetical protein
MENTTTTIEKLLEKVDIYARTTLDIYKYNTIYKSTDIFSSLAVRLAMTVIFVMFSFMVTIALALWIGEELGKVYYGFLVIAAAYLLLGLFLYIFRKAIIKRPVSNFIIGKTLKEN